MIEGEKPDWHPVTSASPGVRHSPHYRFHAAAHQIHIIDRIWNLSNASDSIKQKTAFHLLALWQLGGSDDLARRYLDGLEDLWSESESKRERIIRSIERLEIPQDRVEGKRIIRTLSYPDGSPLERVQGYLDAEGRFVKHGPWETWYPDGRREVYGHFENGDHRGRRFSWDRSGKLTSIESFDQNGLAEYESERLEDHPEYETARQLAETGEPPPR